MSYGGTIRNLKRLCGPHAERVMLFTGLTADGLSEAILEAGLEFIDRHPSMRMQLTYSKAFYAWFKLQWYSLDAQYLAMVKPERRSAESYLKFHKAQLKTMSIPGAVIEQVSKELKTQKAEA